MIFYSIHRTLAVLTPPISTDFFCIDISPQRKILDRVSRGFLHASFRILSKFAFKAPRVHDVVEVPVRKNYVANCVGVQQPFRQLGTCDFGRRDCLTSALCCCKKSINNTSMPSSRKRTHSDNVADEPTTGTAVLAAFLCSVRISRLQREVRMVTIESATVSGCRLFSCLQR